MKQETVSIELKRLNKLQLKYFGFSMEEFLEMDESALSSDELDALARNSSNFYREYFKKVINKLMALQQRSLVENGGKETIDFYRGVLAGQLAVKQWFENQEAIAHPKNTPADEINPTEL